VSGGVSEAGDAGDAGDEAVVDARGERCPLPVIRLARAVSERPGLRMVTVLATDPAAAHDVPAWCRMRGHRFVEARAEADHTAYVVEVVRPSTPAGPR
jgi:TusA-related sulfurtransferase